LLVVEDSDSAAEALSLTLEGIPGLTLRFAASAEEALRLLSALRCSVLITDVDLPGMDGLELLRVLRADPRHQALPVLVISGGTDPKIAPRALALGAVAFHLKPYSPAIVRRQVEEILNAR
jgi:CheY-like chemotaxis protein